ncbi:hypothetical protein [Bacteroides sp.]|nr:hypothetical protein [Bacteroides sp.]
MQDYQASRYDGDEGGNEPVPVRYEDCLPDGCQAAVGYRPP